MALHDQLRLCEHKRASEPVLASFSHITVVLTSDCQKCDATKKESHEEIA